MTTFADLQDRYDSMEPPEFYEDDFEEPTEENDMKMMREEYDVEMMREALDVLRHAAANAGDVRNAQAAEKLKPNSSASSARI